MGNGRCFPSSMHAACVCLLACLHAGIGMEITARKRFPGNGMKVRWESGDAFHTLPCARICQRKDKIQFFHRLATRHTNKSFVSLLETSFLGRGHQIPQKRKKSRHWSLRRLFTGKYSQTMLQIIKRNTRHTRTSFFCS